MLGIYLSLGFVGLLVVLYYIIKHYGAAIAEKDHAQDELREVGEIMKGVKKNEADISNDYANGLPRRMRGKYDID